MLQFFRINDPYRLIFIFFLLIIFRVVLLILGLPLSVPDLYHLVVGERLGEGFTMYHELYDDMGPLSAFVYKWLDIVFGRARWVHVVISTILVIIQAGILNNILLKNKAYEENTYIPAFLYVVLMCGTINFFSLSPQLMSLTFILLSLNHIFRRIDNVVTDELFLFSGLYLGVATFFYFPAVILLFALLLSLILFSSAVLRRLMMFLYGTVTVFLIIWAYFFWNGAGMDFLEAFFWSNATKPSNSIISYLELLELGYALMPVCLLSLTVLISQRLTNYQQKIQQVMILILVGSILMIVVAKDLSSNELLFIIPSTTFFLTYYLLRIRKRIWRFILPNLIIISLIGYPIYWHVKLNDSAMIVKEDRTQLSGERLMGIMIPVDYYLNNTLASPFFDTYLSQKKLNGLDYYDRASDLFAVIDESNPSVILDSSKVTATKIFERFPDIKSRYEEIEPFVYHRVN